MNTELDYIWSRQYAISEDETYDEGIYRVASAVAGAADKYFDNPDEAKRYVDEFTRKYYDLIKSNKFLPGGRVFAGAGTTHGNMLNCFVQDESPFPVGSTKGVLHLAKKLALVTKVGGGNGVNLTPIRAKAPYGQADKVGRVFFQIEQDHDDADNVNRGRFMNLVRGEYEERGYKVLENADGRDEDNVYFIRVPDSVDGIWDSAARMVELMLEGKHVLLDFTFLRPEGADVRGSGGQSSGPASFAVEVFDNFARWAKLGGAEYAGPVATLRYIYAPTLRSIRQGGVRRGAGMATIAATHKDVMDFVTAKDLDREQAEGDIGTFNISVLVDDRTINNYEDGRQPSKRLLEDIAEHAWATGEPGVIFVDTINRNNPLAEVDGPIMATNPCGEIPLYPGEPCDLGAMNLSEYVYADMDGVNVFDFETFAQDVQLAVQFLDDVLTQELSPLPEIHDAIQDKRRIGLGVMGLADMLIKLGVEYDKSVGRQTTNEVISTMVKAGLEKSEELGHTRGVPAGVERAGLERRNIAVFTVAPTGTTSMLAGVSSGVEPVFSAVTFRRVGTEYRQIIHPLLRQLLENEFPRFDFAKEDENGNQVWDWDRLVLKISENHGSIKPLMDSGSLPRNRYLNAFVTAHEVEPIAHVDMQATVQQAFDHNPTFLRTYAGNSISKTINLPNEAVVSDVLYAYLQAWKGKAKGCTVYRDGSRDFQVLSTSNQETTEEKEETETKTSDFLIALEEIRESIKESHADVEEDDLFDYLDEEVFDAEEAFLDGIDAWNWLIDRPETVEGFTDKIQLGQKKLYVTVNHNDEMPVEVFINQSRPTPNERVAADVIGRLISVALKYGAPMEDIAKHLEGHHDETGGFVPKRGYFGSVWGAVASTLRKSVEKPEEFPKSMDAVQLIREMREERELRSPIIPPNTDKNVCPECGSPLVHEEGCQKCHACGFSKCG